MLIGSKWLSRATPGPPGMQLWGRLPPRPSPGGEAAAPRLGLVGTLLHRPPGEAPPQAPTRLSSADTCLCPSLTLFSANERVLGPLCLWPRDRVRWGIWVRPIVSSRSEQGASCLQSHRPPALRRAPSGSRARGRHRDPLIAVGVSGGYGAPHHRPPGCLPLSAPPRGRSHQFSAASVQTRWTQRPRRV